MLLSIDLKYEEEARFRQNVREWRAFYVATMSQLSDSPREIMAGAPQLGPLRQHPVDLSAYVSEWHPSRIKETNSWDLELLYSTDLDVSPNPLAIPAQVTFDSQIRQAPAVIDINRKAVINTAGDLFTDPPAVRNVVDDIIHVSKNLPTTLPAWVQTHVGSVNNDSVTIRNFSYDPGTLWFASRKLGPEENIPGSTDTISTLRAAPFTTVEFELWYRAQGWTEIYPNRGFFQLVPLPGASPFPPIKTTGKSQYTYNSLLNHLATLPPYTRQRITIGPLGDFPPEPVFLDFNGQAIINPTPASIIFLEYDFNHKKPFAVLPFK